MTSRIPFSSDDSDDISSLTGGKIFVDRISGADRLHLKVGTGAIEIVDGYVKLKSAVTCGVQGITFSDGTTQTSKGEAPLIFANSPITSVGGSVARGEGTNIILYTPPTLTSYALKVSPTFTGTVGLPATTSIGSVSATEIGYLDGVSSAIQTQLDATPYYMKAGITSNYTIAATSGTDVLLTNTTERFSGINPAFGDWKDANDWWECPATGIYKINGSLRIAGSPAPPHDTIRKAFVKLAIVNSGGTVIRILNQGGFDMYVETSSEGHNWTINCFAMEQITANDRVALLIEWSVSTGGVIIQGSSSPDSTFLTVEKII